MALTRETEALLPFFFGRNASGEMSATLERRFERSGDVSFQGGGLPGPLDKPCRFAFVFGPTRVVDPRHSDSSGSFLTFAVSSGHELGSRSVLSLKGCAWGCEISVGWLRFQDG